MPVQGRNRQTYKLDLRALHAMCEANYARLLRLFPDYRNCNSRELMVGSAQICLQVVERCRYTTIMRLQQTHASSRWLGRLCVEVRAYHDARMLEVAAFQSHHSVAARYAYPNSNMFQQDEKVQQNRFIADWLEHCLQNGRTPLDAAAPVTDSR